MEQKTNEKIVSNGEVNAVVCKYKPMTEGLAAAGNGKVRIERGHAALVCVDLVNDGSRDEGSFKKIMDFDISMIQKIEHNALSLISAAKARKIPTISVRAIYDFSYIPTPMRERFEAMGIKDGHIAPKGTWGSEIIKEIIDLRPDLILVKSHYSSFSPGHSFIYQLGNDEIEKYLSLPASKDAELKASGIKTMLDYFDAAGKVNESIGKLIDENLANGGVASLDTYLKTKGIDTLIIIGASTHVCVDSTVAGASERSYRVYMPIDAIASEDHERHFVYASNHGVFKAQLTTTSEVLNAIENE